MIIQRLELYLPTGTPRDVVREPKRGAWRPPPSLQAEEPTGSIRSRGISHVAASFPRRALDDAYFTKCCSESCWYARRPVSTIFLHAHACGIGVIVCWIFEVISSLSSDPSPAPHLSYSFPAQVIFRARYSSGLGLRLEGLVRVGVSVGMSSRCLSARSSGLDCSIQRSRYWSR